MNRREFLGRWTTALVTRSGANSMHGIYNTMPMFKTTTYVKVDIRTGSGITEGETGGKPYWYLKKTVEGSKKGTDSRYALNTTDEATGIKYGYCPTVYVIRQVDTGKIVYCNTRISAETGLIGGLPVAYAPAKYYSGSLYLPAGRYKFEVILSGAGYDYSINRVIAQCYNLNGDSTYTKLSDSASGEFVIPNTLKYDNTYSNGGFSYFYNYNVEVLMGDVYEDCVATVAKYEHSYVPFEDCFETVGSMTTVQASMLYRSCYYPYNPQPGLKTDKYLVITHFHRSASDEIGRYVQYDTYGYEYEASFGAMINNTSVYSSELKKNFYYICKGSTVDICIRKKPKCYAFVYPLYCHNLIFDIGYGHEVSVKVNPNVILYRGGDAYSTADANDPSEPDDSYSYIPIVSSVNVGARMRYRQAESGFGNTYVTAEDDITEIGSYDDRLDTASISVIIENALAKLKSLLPANYAKAKALDNSADATVLPSYDKNNAGHDEWDRVYLNVNENTPEGVGSFGVAMGRYEYKRNVYYIARSRFTPHSPALTSTYTLKGDIIVDNPDWDTNDSLYDCPYELNEGAVELTETEVPNIETVTEPSYPAGFEHIAVISFDKFITGYEKLYRGNSILYGDIADIPVV